MDGERLDVGGAISFGWRAMVDNILFFVILGVVYFLILAIFTVPGGFAYKYPYITAILYIFAVLVLVYIHMAVVYISLKVYDGGKPEVSDVFAPARFYWRFLLAEILYGLLVTAGMILCVIPGIYWGVRYHFFGYFIVEQDMGPIEAIKASGTIARGAWWELFFLFFLCWLISIAGAILCGVGLLFAYPIIFMAIVYAYKRVQDTAKRIINPIDVGGEAPMPPPGAPIQ
jgi:uncharacterized membrane protein